MSNKSVYVLLKQTGETTKQTMKVILDNLNNDMAKQYINRCLIHGAEELKKAHIYICGYANIDPVSYTHLRKNGNPVQ